jgi:hypothetical protein
MVTSILPLLKVKAKNLERAVKEQVILKRLYSDRRAQEKRPMTG